MITKKYIESSKVAIYCTVPGRESEYVYPNAAKHHVDKICVKDGLGNLLQIQDNEVCDYLVIDRDLKHSFFVESKRSDVDKAMQSIEKTFCSLKLDIIGEGICVFHMRIVVPAYPGPRTNVKKKESDINVKWKKTAGNLGNARIGVGTLTEEI